jgi:deazaflavin-dependent oxidoreductase (nitroreductase family)
MLGPTLARNKFRHDAVGMLQFTRKVVNPITRRFAGSVPGFAMLTHFGQRSGRTYRTPINVFKRGDDYVFALTYSSDVQWFKNIIAAGSVVMRTRGRDVHLGEPELITDPELRLMPLPCGSPASSNA